MWWIWLLMGTAQAERHTWAREVRTISVENATGDVHVEQGGDRISVRLVPVDDRGCTRSISEDRGEARISLGPARDAAHRCKVHVAIRLPEGASATLAIGAGDIHMVGVHTPVTASLGAGDVFLEGASRLRVDLGAGRVHGRLMGHSAIEVGAGSIDVSGLSEPVSARLGTGSIRLAYDRAPVGRIRASTAHGDVRIDLPDGTPVTFAHDEDPSRDRGTVVDARTGMGRVSVE